MAKFKKNQKFRVISGAACFYATVKDIEAGVGDMSHFNIALRLALDELKRGITAVPPFTGICATFNNINIQLDVVS